VALVLNLDGGVNLTTFCPLLQKNRLFPHFSHKFFEKIFRPIRHF